MRKSLLAIIAAVLPVATAFAEPPGPRPSNSAATTGNLLPLKGAKSANSCAAYGAGFIKVEGTDTCVKIGGAVSIGAGAASGTSVGSR